MIQRVFLSSLLLALSFPDASLCFCAFLFLVPLMSALSRKKVTILRAFSLGMLWALCTAACTAFFIFHAIMVHYDKGFLTALFFFLTALVLPYGLIYGSFTAATVLLRQKNKFLAIIMPPALWVLAEYLIEILPFTIPWITLGHAIVSWSAWSQVADITGPYGLSFMVILTNSLIYHCFSLLKERGATFKKFLPLKKEELAAAGFLALLLIVPPVYGTIRMSMLQTGEKQGSSLKARIIQGNFSSRERWSGSFSRRINTYGRLTAEGIKNKEKPAIVLWPETVLNNPRETTPELFARLSSLLPENTTLIAGGVRKNHPGKETFNTAYVLRSDSLSWYDKQILLPFGETGDVFPLLGTYYQAPSRFNRGKGRKTVNTTAGPGGFSICFEIVYPKHVRNSVRQGALFLVNMSNDAWFGPRVMPRLHLNIARLRAIENRRSVLRASNSGISALIDRRGNITAKTSLFKKESVGGSFQLYGVKTIYTRIGDWPVLLSLLIIAILLFFFIQNSSPAESKKE